MPDGSQTPQVKPDRAAERAAARAPQSNPTAEVEEVRYGVDDLLANPRLLGDGITRPAIVGGVHASTARTFTLDEAAELVRTFLGRPAEGQPDPPIEGAKIDIAGVVS